MKITKASVIVCSPGRNFVTLKIETDEGIYGLGDATLNGREARRRRLSRRTCRSVPDRPRPFQTEDIWQYLYRGAYWRRGPVTMAAIAAVDVALWDIKGKALNTPVYNLLGGKSRDGVLVYTHANGTDIDEALDSVRKAHRLRLSRRPRAERRSRPRLQLRRPQGRQALRARRTGLPSENLWSTEKYLTTFPNSSKTPRAVRRRHPSPPRLSTTASLPSRPRASAKSSNPTTSSGWKTPARRTCRKASNSSASTPPRPSPPARYSTPSGMRTTSSATSGSTTSA